MKNRLEIAKKLLRKDGFIAISIDHYELFYLGVLADEILAEKIVLVSLPLSISQKVEIRKIHI